MRTSYNTFSSLCFCLFLSFMCIGALRADFQPSESDPLANLTCSLVNCGQGTCKTAIGSFPPFDCECYEGWKKIQIGPLTFPSCLVPNCTVDFDCNDNTSPPPPPAPLPSLNLSNPCGLMWCGDGSCVSNGAESICQCNEGSANLMNLKGLPCFKECYFGADCVGLGFGPNTPPPPPPAPPITSGSTKHGSSKVPNSSRTLHALTMLLLAAAMSLSLF